ncbi:MAG TPA: DUF4340 domain-containing protein [Steroidobacteraceae bacterium]|nr:DUF4340 domain-containing protein [Steroidobacteraceae bacterium]HVP32419.1 DUF4340 domain-containing protein [Steroidobacteraceae bacterium]
MTPRRAALLLAGGLALIVFAIWLSSKRHLDRATLAGDLVLPGFEHAVNQVTEVDLRRGDGTRTSLKKASHGWVVGERDWAAEPGKVRKLLLDLGALNVVEEKTRLPANYPQLGVEDVSSPTATGTQIDAVTPTRTFSLIVGKSSSGKSGYVRVAGTVPSLLAAPLLTLDADPKTWLERSVIDLPVARVRQVEEKPAEGQAFTATRDKKEQADFTVAPIPKGRALTSAGAADAIAAALSSLMLEDVQKAAAPAGGKLSHAVFRTFDGLEIEAAGRKDGAHAFLSLKASASAKDAEAESQQLNTRLGGWEFEIPEYKYSAIFRTLEELLQPLPPKPAPKKPAAKAAAPNGK